MPRSAPMLLLPSMRLSAAGGVDARAVASSAAVDACRYCRVTRQPGRDDDAVAGCSARAVQPVIVQPTPVMMPFEVLRYAAQPMIVQPLFVLMPLGGVAVRPCSR